MTSALRGGGGVSPKEDVVREVAWIREAEQAIASKVLVA